MQVDSKLYCYHVNAHIFTHIDVCYTIVNKLYCNIVLIITQEQAENVGSAYAEQPRVWIEITVSAVYEVRLRCTCNADRSELYTHA